MIWIVECRKVDSLPSFARKCVDEFRLKMIHNLKQKKISIEEERAVGEKNFN